MGSRKLRNFSNPHKQGKPSEKSIVKLKPRTTYILQRESERERERELSMVMIISMVVHIEGEEMTQIVTTDGDAQMVYSYCR